MKKTLALILALMMVLCLCACGDKAEETTTEAPVAEAPAVEAAPEAAPAAPVDAPAEAPAEGDASGEPSGEPSGDPSGEPGGAQAGKFLDLSVNAVIPTADAPETYTADEAGWKEYLLDCAYYAMGEGDADNKLGATYYDILNGGMTDMFVNMWGADDQASFIANGGVPAVAPWTLTQGQGTPATAPEA